MYSRALAWHANVRGRWGEVFNGGQHTLTQLVLRTESISAVAMSQNVSRTTPETSPSPSTPCPTPIPWQVCMIVSSTTKYLQAWKHTHTHHQHLVNMVGIPNHLTKCNTYMYYYSSEHLNLTNTFMDHFRAGKQKVDCLRGNLA